MALGILQSERNAWYPVLLGVGFAVVSGLHLAAARREGARIERSAPWKRRGSSKPVVQLLISY